MKRILVTFLFVSVCVCGCIASGFAQTTSAPTAGTGGSAGCRSGEGSGGDFAPDVVAALAQ